MTLQLDVCHCPDGICYGRKGGAACHMNVLNAQSVKKIPGTKNFVITSAPQRKHAHYFKDVSKLNEIDVYMVLKLWEVTDQAIGHALKKLLVAGKRGVKDTKKDIQEVIDTLVRWQEMQKETEDD